MPRKTLLAAAAILCAALACCGILRPPGSLPLGSNRILIENVLDRHDAYISSVDLDTQGAAWLDESRTVSEAIDGAETVGTQWFRLAFEPIAGRHDLWVTEDSELPDYKRSTYLRDTAIIRRTYEPEE